MTTSTKLNAIALACSLAFGGMAMAADQQDHVPSKQWGDRSDAPTLTQWNADEVYRSGWSAEQLLGADVRGDDGQEIGEVKDIIVGRDGTVSKIVAEVGGFLEIGDQHIGVPWKNVTFGPDMKWIQVPLHEVENGTYSLFGRVPQGEQARAAADSWRVNELIGDYASLSDVPRYGIVSDVIFDQQGKAEAVVVERNAGPWGNYGRYAYPYVGYRAGAHDYGLPYATAEVVKLKPFDYARLSGQQRFADGPVKLGAPPAGGTSGQPATGSAAGRK